MERYRAEIDKCMSAYVRDFTSLPTLLGDMVGWGDWRIGMVSWASIIIPLALLWFIGWGLGRVVRWVGDEG